MAAKRRQNFRVLAEFGDFEVTGLTLEGLVRAAFEGRFPAEAELVVDQTYDGDVVMMRWPVYSDELQPRWENDLPISRVEYHQVRPGYTGQARCALCPQEFSEVDVNSRLVRERLRKAVARHAGREHKGWKPREADTR